MPEAIRVSAVIPVKRTTLYDAWLDSKEHAAFTGGRAHVDPKVGGKYSAWDGYISGKTLLLRRGQKIVQSWRTTDFPEGSPDSRLVVLFEDNPRRPGRGSFSITRTFLRVRGRVTGRDGRTITSRR
jgi:uncharacterized protein YndB with AHSA1/START domain